MNDSTKILLNYMQKHNVTMDRLAETIGMEIDKLRRIIFAPMSFKIFNRLYCKVTELSNLQEVV